MIKEIINLKFNPYLFLISLGAGGIASMIFAFLNYTIPHGAGLINISQIIAGTNINSTLFMFLYISLILFIIIHFIVTLILIPKWYNWIKSEEYKSIKSDPIKSPAILVPFVSILMSMNVIVGGIRFLIIPMAENLQSLMLPALIVWIIIYILLMHLITDILFNSFKTKFDSSKIGFSWLMYAFSLSMLSVTGSGFAALSKDFGIASIAAALSTISLTMGIFLFIIIISIVFKNQLDSDSLPEKELLPSTLIIIPITTLFSITLFRLGHYLEKQLEYHLGPYFLIVIGVGFAFEIWYLFFSSKILYNFFRNNFRKKEYYISQWSLICSAVAFSVLGSFLYAVFVPNILIYYLIITFMIIAMTLYLIILIRQLKCMNILNKELQECY